MWNTLFHRVIPPDRNNKYTLELRELINGGIDIWDFDYPSYYKGEEKTAFERKVIDHFYFRQIGQETPARWLHYFRARMREIMPYYIQLYESAELMKDPDIKPLDNYCMTEDYTEDTDRTNTVNGTSNNNSTVTGTHSESSNAQRRSSETPQGSISNIDNYLTNAQKDTNTGSGESSTTDNGTSTVNNTETDKGKITHKLTRRGNIGVTTYAQMLQGYRDTFLNIDTMIIHELNDLFLQVY